MRATLTFAWGQFNTQMEIAIERVLRGTKKATTAACQDILAESLRQVPRRTGALARSAFYRVEGSYRDFTGIVGYGNGAMNDARGVPVDTYMIAVHEDLSAVHPVGKAKFLEDPVREYELNYSPRATMIIRRELGG